MTSISSDEIRKLVREALREVLPQAKANGATGGTSEGQVEVAIANDADLNQFARDIAKADEAKKAAILSGKLRFTFRRNETQSRAGTHRIDKGVLTETMVVEIGRGNSRIIVGKTVAVTPLARDKAREVKLEIVRDKP